MCYAPVISFRQFDGNIGLQDSALNVVVFVRPVVVDLAK